MNSLKNKIIIIGADHHNTLAAIRCFGSIGCRTEVLFILSTPKNLQDIRCAHSKYCKGKASIVNRDEKTIIKWLMDHGKEDGEMVILFPCNDFAAYTLDSYRSLLERHFIFPGIKNKAGRISFLMDKWNQFVFAKEHCIPMAKTWKYILDNSKTIPEDVVFPCIVKPNLSAYGNKEDIRICNTDNELINVLQAFKLKNYNDVLIQQFIKKDFEVCAFGCLVDVGNDADSESEIKILLKANYGCCIKKKREYPTGGGGSTSYAVTITDPKIERILDKILCELYKEGYRGDYDIELLVLDGIVYLNEINFRQSANVYALGKFGIPAPYINCIGLKGMSEYIEYCHRTKDGLHLMNELSDIEHVKNHEISLFSWTLEFINSSAYAFYSLHDLAGTYAFYKPVFISVLKKIMKRFKRFHRRKTTEEV